LLLFGLWLRPAVADGELKTGVVASLSGVVSAATDEIAGIQAWV
jgi:hypothetical protein